MICQCACKGSVASDDVTYTRLYTPSLVSEPTTGHAYSTEFTFRVVDVRSGFESKLLAYRFGYQPDSSPISKTHWLTGWTSSSLMENARLPSSMISTNGAVTMSYIKVFAQIRTDDRILDQVFRIVPVTRPAQNADNTVLLRTLSKLTNQFLVYDLFKGAALLNAQIRLQANLNHLAVKRKRKRRALPESDLQHDVIQLIDVTMASPYQPETIDQALWTVNDLVVKSNGRLHADMVAKIKDLLKYVTEHQDFLTLRGDVNYGTQVSLHLVLSHQQQHHYFYCYAIIHHDLSKNIFNCVQNSSLQFDTVLQTLGILILPGSKHISTIRPSLESITQKYLVKMLHEKDSPFLNQTSWFSPQIRATYSSFHFIGDPTTILKMDGSWFKDRFTSWDCDGGSGQQNCSGFYISEVRYTSTLYDDQLYDRYTGGPITDIYQVDAWYLNPSNNQYERLDFGNETLFEVNFPLNDLTTLIGDDIQVGNIDIFTC